MVDYSKKEFWTEALLLSALGQHATLPESITDSTFEQLWILKLWTEDLLGTKITPFGNQRIYELQANGEYHYVQVESNYNVSAEAKGKKDAVNIFMAVEDVNEIDISISVPTAEARKFAHAIINICNDIDS